MSVPYRYLDSFGFERIGTLGDSSIESFEKQFDRLESGDILNLKLNPVIFGFDFKYIQFIELHGKPLVYHTKADVDISLMLRDSTTLDIYIKNLFIDRNRDVASRHLCEEIKAKYGYTIDCDRIQLYKNKLHVKELDISFVFKSARNI